MSRKTEPKSPSDLGRELILKGTKIGADVNGLICLDDIWRVAKAAETRVPPKWRALRGVKRLEDVLRKKIAISALKENKQIIPIAYSRRGRGNTGTYAHPVLAAAYAGYLSPALEIEMREVWLRYRAADASLADEILQCASPEDNERVAIRALGRVKRNQYTKTLQDHGVEDAGYAICTNVVYRQVMGADAAVLKRQRQLPARANLRDDLNSEELTFIMAAEHLAANRIAEEECAGNNECAIASERSARFISEAIERDKKDRRKKAS